MPHVRMIEADGQSRQSEGTFHRPKYSDCQKSGSLWCFGCLACSILGPNRPHSMLLSAISDVLFSVVDHV
eukprot:2675676-Amphidinium_carterae.2